MMHTSVKENVMKTSIYVVSHKDVTVPNDVIYQPVQVGFNEKNFAGFSRDNQGDNIADKNANYCELTAQYWGWKNDEADIKGVVHYRRLFSNEERHLFDSADKKRSDILDEAHLNQLLERYDLILPKKRNYYIETLWSHYEHSHHIEGLVVTKQVIEEFYPEYVEIFDEVMQRKSAHMFNMLIAKDNVFEAYNTWLFDVLQKVEERIDITNYTPSEARIFGYISELLMDVWVDQNKINYAELPVMFMEKQNWIKKGGLFLKRKLLKK